MGEIAFFPSSNRVSPSAPFCDLDNDSTKFHRGGSD